MQSDDHCLLVGKFNQCTFNVIADKQGLTSAILLFVLHMCYAFYSSIPPLLPSFALCFFVV